mgnify:CR=1 FL=1
MDSQEQEFIKGFNAGYQLSKHDPTLLSQLLASGNNEKEYFKAMALGKQEHDREKVVEKMRTSLKKEKGKGKGFDRDR